MYALQVKLLVTLAVVVVLAVWLAAAAVPADAGPSTVSVSVTVRSNVALTVSGLTGPTGEPSMRLTSNVDCFAQTCVVERGTTTFSALTIVPAR